MPSNTNKASRPTEPPHWFDTERFEQKRQESAVRWGRPLVLLSSVGSTNDLALAAVRQGKPTGALWIAREQSAGRGRRGRSWIATPGDALLLSILLRFPASMGQAYGLSLTVGLALRKLIEATLEADSNVSAKVRIKWPNDVYVGEKKVAGILIESEQGLDGAFGFAVGIGLNVLTEKFSSELPEATSLLLEGAPRSSCDFESLTIKILEQMEQKVSKLLTQGLSGLLEELREYDFLLGQLIRVGGKTGFARGIGSDGQLLLEDDAGKLHRIISGTVEREKD